MFLRVFLILSSIYKKHFFDKIKTDHRKMAICGRKTGYLSNFLIFSKYMGIINPSCKA